MDVKRQKAGSWGPGKRRLAGDSAGGTNGSDLERATIRHGGGIDEAAPGAADGAGEFEDLLAGPLRRVQPGFTEGVEFLGGGGDGGVK